MNEPLLSNWIVVSRATEIYSKSSIPFVRLNVQKVLTNHVLICAGKFRAWRSCWGLKGWCGRVVAKGQNLRVTQVFDRSSGRTVRQWMRQKLAGESCFFINFENARWLTWVDARSPLTGCTLLFARASVRALTDIINNYLGLGYVNKSIYIFITGQCRFLGGVANYCERGWDQRQYDGT